MSVVVIHNLVNYFRICLRHTSQSQARKDW